MPILHWIGKDKVINHHMDVPYRVLEHSYSYELGVVNDELKTSIKNIHHSSLITPNSSGAIIHGDNLEALKALLPEYEGRIKCIYIDPPYNTGNEGWVYNDNVNDPKIKKWLGQVVGKESEDLSRHDKWLCMMYPRLKLLHKLLSDDGAIFISIDDNEQANLKLICDEIFGIRNFVGTYFWYKSGTPPNLSHKIKRNIEYVLCYTKTLNSNKFQGIQKTSKSDDPITKPQNSFKELSFKPKSLNIRLKDGVIKKGVYGTEKFPNELLNDLIIKNGTNENEVTFKNRFIWVQDKLEEELAKSTIVKINSKSLVISYKKQNYSREVPPNFIDSSVGVDTTENAGRMLHEIFGKKVFDFPKTPSLIEYLINFNTDTDDIILDSFAGSGTTAHAVLNLNKQDGGNRKFILVEMEDYAETITAERVKRVMKKMMNDEFGIMNEKSDKIHNSSFITHNSKFDFYELGQPMFLEDGNLNELVGVEKIRQYVYYTETQTNYELRVMNDEIKGVHNSSLIDHHSFLGKHNDTAYYFHYEPDAITTLDHAFLATLKTEAEQYVIYADNCLLTKEYMTKHHIIFKKIPRDVTKL